MGMAPYYQRGLFRKTAEPIQNIPGSEGVDFAYKNKPADMYFTIKDLLEGERFDSI